MSTLKILNPLYIVLFSVCITGCNHHKREVTGTGNVADPVINTQPGSLKEVTDMDDSPIVLQPSIQYNNATNYTSIHRNKKCLEKCCSNSCDKKRCKEYCCCIVCFPYVCIPFIINMYRIHQLATDLWK